MPLDEAGRRLIAERNGQQLGALVNTPGQILSEMDAVNRLVDGIGVDVNDQKSRLPKALVKGWEQFWNEWKGFYSRNLGLGARLWGGVYDQTQQYKARADVWQQKLAKAGAQITPERLPTPSGWDTKKILVYAGIGTAVLVGLFIAGKLIHTIVLGRSGIGTLGDAEAAAVTLMDAQRRRRRVGRRGS